MKIVVELLKIRQEWNPDTNEHVNSVVFSFAGVAVEIPIGEEQLRKIIVASQGTGGAKETEELPELPQEVAEELDKTLEAELAGFDEQPSAEEFGGDYADSPVRAPQIFQSEPTPLPQPLSAVQQREAAIEARRAQDPSKARQDAKAKMRERAQAVPRRKVEVDEAGNPVIGKPDKKIVGSAGQPEVVVHRRPGPTDAGDDDGFAQG